MPASGLHRGLRRGLHETKATDMLNWGPAELPTTPSELLATAKLVTRRKKRKRLRYPQHEASSFSVAAFRGQVTQEVRGKNHIREQRVTTQNLQSPLISSSSALKKFTLYVKKINGNVTDNLQENMVQPNLFQQVQLPHQAKLKIPKLKRLQKNN